MNILFNLFGSNFLKCQPPFQLLIYGRLAVLFPDYSVVFQMLWQNECNIQAGVVAICDWLLVCDHIKLYLHSKWPDMHLHSSGLYFIRLLTNSSCILAFTPRESSTKENPIHHSVTVLWNVKSYAESQGTRSACVQSSFPAQSPLPGYHRKQTNHFLMLCQWRHNLQDKYTATDHDLFISISNLGRIRIISLVCIQVFPAIVTFCHQDFFAHSVVISFRGSYGSDTIFRNSHLQYLL